MQEVVHFNKLMPTAPAGPESMDIMKMVNHNNM